MKITNVAIQALVSFSLVSSPFAMGCTERENAGFEKGDFSCWATSVTSISSEPIPTVASSFDSPRAPFTSFQAPYGDKMAIVPGGCPSNVISRTFTGPISGQAAWEGGDYLPYNDGGLVRVIEDGTVLFQANIAQYGDYGDSPWMPFTYSSPSGNPYTLELINTNLLDCILASSVLFDLEEISLSAGGPYVALVGTETNILGQLSGCSVCSTEWSVDCSNGAVGSFADASSLETTISFPSDSEPGICSLVLSSGGVTSTTTVIVADPTAGFVTGGGYIISPGGAYVPQPSLIGPASFGFVSKYKKGSSVPSGDTIFEFETAGLVFESTAYEWLVITGADCAKFKGEGTVNGASGFGFMLTACDNGEPGGDDTFHIKIWDSEEAVIYDNDSGVTDDSFEGGTAISGGNIQIHQSGGKGKFLRA